MIRYVCDLCGGEVPTYSKPGFFRDNEYYGFGARYKGLLVTVRVEKEDAFAANLPYEAHLCAACLLDAFRYGEPIPNVPSQQKRLHEILRGSE